MKNYVFVVYKEENVKNPSVELVSGRAAQSQQTFENEYMRGVKIEILAWFPLKNSNIPRGMFRAFLALNALNDGRVVNDFLAAIFEAGYQCGKK